MNKGIEEIIICPVVLGFWSWKCSTYSKHKPITCFNFLLQLKGLKKNTKIKGLLSNISRCTLCFV